MPLFAALLASALHTRPCTQGKTKVPATCGTLRVYENRAAQSGRTIGIHFILLKAKHPSGHVIYVNLGGPASELQDVPFIADGDFLKELAALRDRYDELFVDERGFGESHRIGCDLAPPAQPQVYFAQLWPSKILAACRAKSARIADLAQYNTTSAIGDLDDLRAALGYDKLIFDVGSYGTFTAFLYMRAYPQHVESAVMMGVAPPGIMNLSREFAKGSQVALDRLAASCARDAVCSKKFPDFEAHFYAVLHRMDRGPMPVRMKNDVTKKVQTVLLSREVFADNMRHMLYDPEGSSYLPYVIDHAYHGDTLPLGQIVDWETQAFASLVDAGAYLSYTCAELMPSGNSPADLAQARKTWFGDDRARAQLAACKIWNVPAMPAAFFEPVRSGAPILMFSGTNDPAAPAYDATQELGYLWDARQMLIENAPHDAESPCTDRTAEKFIRSGGSWKGIDLDACTANFARTPFATTWPPQ
ncbi:MAG TPA: alpha/beta fold hydrolase [Candidatus Acidoferrales bacterium]|nr:alpha/beta fold hydrolase [Candidatus Acidoferrales bacterium]